MKNFAFLDWSMTTNAAVRAWLTNFHANLIAFGWVQTSDTGQVNPATVTFVAAGNDSTTGSMGYLVYHSNDGLTTYYVRVEFYRTSNIAPWLKITMGWATDGAGNITGNSQVMFVMQSNKGIGGTQHCLMAGGAGWFTINGCSNINDVSSAFLGSVERDRDHTGAEVNNGIVGLAYTNQGRTLSYIPLSGFVPPQMGDWPIAQFQYGSYHGVTQTVWTSTYMNLKQLACFPVPMKEFGGGYACMGMAVIGVNDVFFEQATRFTHYGADHDYVKCGGWGPYANGRIIVRWE